MNIGLMGGTFDPPHKAHILMAEAALEKFSLNKIMFMTGGNPPHKSTDTDAKIRNKMIKIAISGNDKFEICDYEINKKGYSYTSDTLKYLKKTYPEDTFYFIIGGDSLKNIFRWHEPYDILSGCTIIVYPRDNYPSEEEVRKFNKEHNADVRLLDCAGVDISSTDIRNMIENGEDVSGYIDEDVLSYIERNNLYKATEKDMEEHLKSMLTQSRYIHSLGVAKTSVEMAERFGENPEKAYIAGLLHDCAKDLSDEDMLKKCNDLDAELDEFECENKGLIHAKLGAELVKLEFDICDDEIINAIKWHTIGKPYMSKLEKIIYVADMIEPERNYPEVEFLRKAAQINLDTAVLECVSAIIQFNERKGRKVHKNAYLLKEQLLNDGVKGLKNLL